MRWQRPLRWTIAVAGLGFAALLYVRFERKPIVPSAPPPPPMQGGASYESVMSPGARQVRYKDNKEISSISFSKLVQFSDGRRVVEHPRFEGDRDGKPFVVTADKGELRAGGPGTDPNEIPEETHLTGNVVLSEQGGIEIKCGDATYRESAAMLDIPGPMSFLDGRVSGASVGAVYDRNGQLLTLSDQASVNIAPDESGRGRLDARARTIVLDRGTHFLQMDGAATVARDRETLQAESALLHLTEENQGVQMMELHGSAKIVPVPGTGDTPEMRADDMALEFQADGRTMKRAQLTRHARILLAGAGSRRQVTGDMLDVQLGADGQAVTGLAGSGAPVELTLPAGTDTPTRVIRGRELVATGTEREGLTSAVFRQNVEFVESRPAARGQAAVRRTATARQLTLALDAGDLSAIKEARFREAVIFRDGATTGKADDANYLAAAGKLSLRPSGATGRKAEVSTERISVDARSIDLDLARTIIDASGSVTSRTRPDKAKARTGKGLFDESREMLGVANELHYDDQKNQAVYNGGARLWQGAGPEMNMVQADSIAMDDQAGNLTAEGQVVTLLPIDNIDAATAGPPRATAAKLAYQDGSRRAIYTGTEKALAQFNGPDGILRGVTIELSLSAEGRELERMVVAKSVAARISADQTARGDRMDHDVKTGQYILTGNPAQIIRRKVESGVEQCSATLGPSVVYTKSAETKDKGNMTMNSPGGEGTTTMNLKTCQDWTIK